MSSRSCQNLAPYWIIKIKHTFRKRAVQPITTEEGSILSHNTADQVDKYSTNKSNWDKNEQYDERRRTLQAPTQYDYDGLRDEYYNDLQKELHSNISFNYTQHDRFEETNEDTIKEVFNFKTTENCSKEEYSTFEIKSIICSWDGLKKSHTKQDKMRFFRRLMKSVAIWLLICTVIGTTCACEFGKYIHRVLLSSRLWAQPYIKPMSTGTSCDSCHVQRHHKRGTS